MSRWVYRGPPNFPFTLNRESSQARGLVIWWPMLASRGANSLRDLANSNNGVFSGDPSWESSAQFGAVLDFDGFVDRVQNDDTFLSQITLSSPWTMAQWVIYDSLLGFRLGIGVADRSDEEYASIGSDGTSTKIATAGKTPGDGATLSVGVWYHQTLVWDGTDLISYLDGVFDYSVTPTSAIIWADIDTFIQGMLLVSGSPIQPLDGRLTDGRLYNRQLSAIEIYQLYAPQTRGELYLPAYRPMLVRKVSVPPAGILPFQSNMEGNMQMLTGGIHG